MSLQYKFFIIPVKTTAEAESELNHFLKTVRVITIHREFVSQGENSFWTMAVEYLSDRTTQQSSDTKTTGTGKNRIDYREVLSPENFAIYSKLREWRKETAAQEGVPVYALFTNEQLAKIVEKRIASKSSLQEIESVGEARIRKYGDAVIRIMSEEIKNLKEQKSKNETEGKPVSSDPGTGKSAAGVLQSSQRQTKI